MFIVTSTHYRKVCETFPDAVIAAHARILSKDADHAEIWDEGQRICRQYYWKHGSMHVAV